MAYTTAARNEDRDRYVPLIRAILERGPEARGDIATELGLNPNTLTIYLRYMHQTLGEIRRGPIAGNNSFRWELGEDPALCYRIEKGDQRTVPARQVGMWRDSLVAALFGPGQGAAA